MQPLICPVCGASNSEFDRQCAACGATLPSPSETTWVNGAHHPKDGDEIRPGQQISHFRILGRLGRGGMGEVYRALDLSPLNRQVALKFLQERRKRDLARFEREAQTAASLNDHPNIGTIYEIGEWKGRRFIVMALYDGETLAKRLARQVDHKLSIPEAAGIACQLANALKAAHAVHLVHRDLKPENVMILPDGRVKLIDFGLARWAGSSRLTAEGLAVGTIPYMSPEQFDGEKEAGSEADLWALGVVLYEMLAGRHPFGGKGMAMMQSIVKEEPFPLRQARPDVPATLEKIVERCLVKDPRKRSSSAGDILAKIEDSGLLGSGSVVLPPRLPAWRRWLIVVTAVLLIGVVGYILSHQVPTPIHKDTGSPTYVTLLQPVVSGSLNASGQAQVLTLLKTSLLRTVQVLDGLAAQDRDQFPSVKAGSDLVAAARIVAADEIVTSKAHCAGDLCQVTLSRLSGSDGSVLWTKTLQQKLSHSSLLFSAESVASSLWEGFASCKLRVSQLKLGTTKEDYLAYLKLRQPDALHRNSQQVFGQLEAMRKRDPNFLEAYLLEARLDHQLFQSGDHDTRYLDSGIAVARKALKLAPSDPRLLLGLSDLYQDSHQYLEAESVLKRLAAADAAESNFQRGLLAALQEDHQTELRLIAEAARLHPSLRFLTALATREYSQGRLEDARSHFKEILRREPNSVDGLRGLGQIALLQNPDRAVVLYRRAAELDPGADSLTNLGTYLILMGRFTEAEGSLRQALARKPADPSATLNLADCLLLLHRPEAQQLYLQVVAITEHAVPGDWQLLSVRAQALAHLGEKRRAIETILTALSIAPKSDQLAYEAALVYTTVGEKTVALVYAQRASMGRLNFFYFKSPFLDSLRDDPDFQRLAKPPA